jgi:hypothetical protein
MRRGEFLRKLFVGVAAAALAPALVEEVATEKDVLEAAAAQLRSAHKKFCISFKITTEALQDEKAFLYAVDGAIDKRVFMFNRQPDNIEVRMVEDDFIRGWKTVLLTWYYV